MGLFEDCFDGSLTTTNLKRYLVDNDINAPHPKKGVTPLIAAIFSGHVTVVKRLLEVGEADANAPSVDEQTPLLWASVTRKNRAGIVHLLLEHKADVDARCQTTQLNTPLMRVLNDSRDPDVIRLLVEAGASLTIENKKRETAEDIARKLNNPAVNTALYPSKSFIDLETLVKVIVGLIGIIIAWVNSETVNNVVKGVMKEMNEVVKNMHGMTGERDAELEKKVWDKEPRTPAEFKESIDTFVNKTGLETFFSGPNKHFLQTVAEKATELLDDPMDPLSKPENIKTLIRVSMFRPVIYCDDSGSMLKDDRQKAQADLVERIARITTRLVPEGEGVELRFINKSADDLSGLDEKGIRERMNELKITPGSYTQIGIGLKEKILKPLVYEPLESKEGLTRPLLVCIITDGYPQNPPTVGPVAGLNREQPETTKNNIDECGEKLDRAEYPRSSVRFLVNQIGKSDKAREFLEDLGNDTRLSDVVHVTTDMLDDKWKELRDNKQHLEEWLLQTLLAPIVNKGPD